MKRIDASHMKSVQAKFDLAQEELNKSASDLIESDATKAFQAATTAVKGVTSSLMDTVSSLDTYLDEVANAFAGADTSIKNAIEGSVYEFKEEKAKQAEDRQVRRNKEQMQVE